MNVEQPLNLSFGPVAEAYDRGRPGYSEETARWLLSLAGQDRVLEILEVGAGTGKLTAELVALGHVVHACDPSEGMLDVLARNVPEARTKVASAEDLPYGDRTFDVVIAAQAFHWFDAEPALAEFARVLRPTGHLALVWHERDVKIPWVRRFGSVLGSGGLGAGGAQTAVEPLIASRHFGVVEEAAFKNWQRINSESVLDLALSRSAIASLPAEERALKLEAVLDFYSDFGRGMDGMELPYWAQCFAAKVIERAQPSTPPREDAATDDAAPATSESDEEDSIDPLHDTAIRDVNRPRATDIFRSDGTDTDMLLIDFH